MGVHQEYDFVLCKWVDVQRMNTLPVTASATLAALEENERRFKERVKKIVLDLPHHRSILDALTSGVPRSRSLVRIQDTPVFAMYWWFYMHQNWRCPTYVVTRTFALPKRVRIRNVKASGEWVGIYGS